MVRRQSSKANREAMLLEIQKPATLKSKKLKSRTAGKNEREPLPFFYF